MKRGFRAGLLCILAIFLFGCDLVMDKQTGQLLRQEISKFRGESDKLAKEVAELAKATAELRQEISLLREARTAAPRPSIAVEREPLRDREPLRNRDNGQAAAPRDLGLCDIVETHITAVEGVLSQPSTESMDTLMDDLQAAFEGNLKKYANHPRIAEMRDAAANMRSNMLTAAKQGHLAGNPYLKNVRQKSINEGRKFAKLLRSLCED